MIKMAKMVMKIELEYDAEVMHGNDPDGMRWFIKDVLSDDLDNLFLCSKEIGDIIGNIRILELYPKKGGL